MTWFRVDDEFGSHPKVVRIPRVRRAQAIGLWLLAGTWCARHLTDGHLPAELVAELGGKPIDAAALVTAGLWHAEEGGYVFHDWSPIQPTKAEVEAKRTARSEAGAKGGKASGQARRGLRAVGDD